MQLNLATSFEGQDHLERAVVACSDECSYSSHHPVHSTIAESYAFQSSLEVADSEAYEIQAAEGRIALRRLRDALYRDRLMVELPR